MARRSLPGPVWLAIPFAIFLVVLSRLWSNAPVWDDYFAVLYDAMVQLETKPLDRWWVFLVRPHNEHRIAVDRLVAWALAKGVGQIDFRAMMALGVSSIFGAGLLMWAQFRREVPPILFLAAGLLLFQWSWFEAALTASSLVNLAVLSFAIASLYFAPRPGALAAAVCVAFAILAIGCQANGLFVLPIAAAGAVHAGLRPRAVLFAGVGIVAVGLYLVGYHGNVSHPSPLYALHHPVDAAQFFLIVVGGILPGLYGPTLMGALFIGVMLWLARAGVWRKHPGAALWVVFILASAAAAAVGRVGFGVVYTSRYAIYSSALAAILLLSACAATGPWGGVRIGAALAVAAFACVGATWLSWPALRTYSVNGHRLMEAVPASPDVQVQRYFGMFFPIEAKSAAWLADAQARGIYAPPRVTVYPTRVVMRADMPPNARVAGSFDNFQLNGNKLTVGGWSDIPATVEGRTLAVVPAEGSPAAGRVSYDDRRDVAMARLDPMMAFGGFHFELEYPSEELARRAAASICIVASAPGHGEAVLPRRDVDCRPARSDG